MKKDDLVRLRHMLHAVFASIAVSIALIGGMLVGASTQVTVAAESPQGMAFSPDVLFSRCSPAVVRVVVRDENLKVTGFGSGFFVSPDGTLVTNHHVVKNARFATVLLSNGATFFVDSLVAWDQQLDLAIMKVNGDGLPTLAIVPIEQAPRVGARVYAIGNPEGLTNTLSEGIVSGLRPMDGIQYLQTTTAISPGSSGGPLLDCQGRVVGVTTFAVADEKRLNQNLNFAVPSECIRAVLAKVVGAKPIPLGSAGGKSFDRGGTDEFEKAWQAMSSGRWGEAVQTLTRLKEKYPENAQVWYALGNAHQNMGNYGLAIEAFKRVTVLRPDFIYAFYEMAECYLCLRKFPEAAEAYKRITQLEPDRAEGMFVVLYVAGRYGGCENPRDQIEACKAVVTVLPTSDLAFRILGIAYREVGTYAEAIESLRRSLVINPGDSLTRWNLGEAFRLAGRYREAIQEYQSVIKADPKEAARSYYSMALVQIALRDKQGAMQTYQSLRKIAPEKANELLGKILKSE